MECRDSRDGRWSISLCTCSKETIHFTYGNATMHVLIDDIGNLGMALKQLDDALKSREGLSAERKHSMH
jgi:hypothetical protein